MCGKGIGGIGVVSLADSFPHSFAGRSTISKPSSKSILLSFGPLVNNLYWQGLWVAPYSASQVY